jgi:hypothetical protein
MYWRRSLIVTVILLVLGFGLNSLVYTGFFTWLYTTSEISAVELASISTVFSLVTGGLLHFFVLWAAFRYYASPVDKAKRNSNKLTAQDVIGMLSEEEVAALRDHLLPPSQRE